MPGFFGDQADRLLRKNWTDPMELAQELWAMFNADVPMTTNQPIIQTRNADSVPALTIIDNTEGTRSPIVINKTDKVPSPQPNTDSGGSYSCCGSSGQNQQPNREEPSKFPERTPPGTVGPAPPPSGGGGEPPKDPNVPYKTFVAQVTIEIHQGDPDIYGFDGTKPVFTATGCFPFKLPSIPGPTTGFDEGFDEPATIQAQIDFFMLKWGLDGYEVISDAIIGPGANC